MCNGTATLEDCWFPIKLNIFLLYYPAVLFLGIYQRLKTNAHKDFIAALLIVAKTWKQPRCSSAGEWINCGSSRQCSIQFSSVSCVWLFATPWTVACQASLFITNSWRLPKLLSIDLVMPSNHLILCHPFSSHLQSLPESGSFPMIKFFTQVATVLEFQLQH